MQPFTELCGTYVSDCRASGDNTQNVKVTVSLLGNSFGQFTLMYDYYPLSDTTCDGAFQSSYHISGTYALHGPSDCDGKCQVCLV